MASSFRSFLVNDLFGDPALYVGLSWERRALLFDLGDISRLSAGHLLKITDVFVSHTHIDHFIGFDHLLRVLLGRPKALRIFGPPGMIGHVEGKLSAYTWNLVDTYTFSIEVFEVHPHAVWQARFSCPEEFRRHDDPVSRPFEGTILDEANLRVRAVPLDHRIPCLAFALEEPVRLNVDPDRLKGLGLPVGPWLMDVKRAIRRGEPDGFAIHARWSNGGQREERELPLGALRREVIRETPGQKLVYVTDCRSSHENERKVIALAQGADQFYCEAGYPDRDAERAADRFHLTAGQAGRLAAAAGAKHLAVFHLSPKYRENPGEIVTEAMATFATAREEAASSGGQLLTLP
jgi:ribonuclease Z